ncbi:hypothetical protein VPH35_095973 [Triticum aestivum]
MSYRFSWFVGCQVFLVIFDNLLICILSHIFYFLSFQCENTRHEMMHMHCDTWITLNSGLFMANSGLKQGKPPSSILPADYLGMSVERDVDTSIGLSLQILLQPVLCLEQSWCLVSVLCPTFY